MKIFLTSGGITNNSIKKAFLDLVGKPASKVKVAFIPTASNVDRGDKDWLLRDLSTLRDMKLAQIDIVDISAISKSMMQGRLNEADVLFFEGGNTFHLMYWIKKSGLKKLLKKELKDKVWVGVSAGSIVAGEKLVSADERLYDEEIGEYKGDDGLGLVNFSIRPHVNNKFFPKVTFGNVGKIAADHVKPIYALDDDTAIVINDDKIKIVSEGKWKKFQ